MAEAALDGICGDAFKGDTAAVQAALKAHPEYKDKLSRTRQSSLLYTAARFGHLDLVKYLVEDLQCDINKKCGDASNQSSPLHGAAFGGHWKVVQFLAENGAKLQENAFGDTPLQDAVSEFSEAPAASQTKCKEILTALKNGKVVVKPKAQKAPSSPKPTKPAPPPDPEPTPAPKPSPAPAPKADPPAPKPSPAKPALDESALKAMTVPQLKAKCAEVGVSDKGTKAVLIKNILQSGDAQPGPDPKKQKTSASASASAGGGDDLLNPISKVSVDELKSAAVTFTEIDKDTNDFWDMEDLIKAHTGRNEDYIHSRIKNGKKPLMFLLQKAEKVHNAVLERRFERRKAELKKIDPSLARERVSFHGTNKKHIESICRTCLLRFKHPLNPCKSQSDDGYFGSNRKGVYVSRHCDYTLKYSNDMEPIDEGQIAKIIMFRTLPGKSHHITKLVGGIDPTPGFQSHSSPHHLEWYVFNEDQLCPSYVITLKAVEDVRTVADDEELGQESQS